MSDASSHDAVRQQPVWPALTPDPLPATGISSPGTSASAGSDSGEPSGAARPTGLVVPRGQHADAAALDHRGTGDRTRAAVALWRKRLLDLTRRNRALNFRPTKVSTVLIVDEQPGEVYRHLCLEGRPMRFKPTLPSAARKGGGNGAASGSDEAEQGATALPGGVTLTVTMRVQGQELVDGDRLIAADDADEPRALELDYAPYDPEALDDRHTDDVLQAQATPEALDKSLRRLDEQARATIDEQGVNVLFLALGMLHYTESADSAEVFRAPLVMVPVELVRKSARTGYQVRASDDDEPMVNPALVEYLTRQHGLALPELPTVGEDGSAAPDLQTFYRAVADVVAERRAAGSAAWAVKTDIALAMFSFQKLVMFKDLEANGEAIASHRLVRQLITREAPAGVALSGLPDDVRSLELDAHFAPEATAQVVDADASQLRSIAAISRGYDAVIEGPPGTGKSQTITNLIAQALADGKSVLFVAEKMAALNVVHSRLVSAGLGEFCLELHAAKANKRTVLQELRAAVDASLQRMDVPKTTHGLPAIRASLTAYARAVHTPHGALGVSPYTAYGMLGAVLDAPRLPLRVAIDAVTPEVLEETERRLADLAATAEPVGVPGQHPWRDTTRVFYTPAALDALGAELAPLVDALERTVASAREVEEAFALPAVRTLADVETAARIAAVFRESPGAPLTVLESEAWNAPPAEATALLDAGRQLQRWRQQVDQKFTEAVLDQEHASDIAFIEAKTSGLFGFLAILNGRFRAIKRRWLGYRKSGYARALVEQATDLKLVDQYRRARQALDERAATGQALFGALWQGERSDWALVERYVAWVVEVRGMCTRHGLSGRALAVAARPAPDVSRVEALRRLASELATPLAALRESVGWPADHLADAPITEILERVRALAAHLALAPQWAAFEQARQRATETPAAELVALAMRNTGGESDVAFDALARAFRRALLETWLDQVVTARPELREFQTLSHERRLEEFRKLDERVLHENRAAVVRRLRATAQQRLQEPAAAAGIPWLRKEWARQRSHSPLRRTMQQAEAAIRAIKPCFLMSPLTVAQYLKGDAPSFDLVIFDEASQLPSEDAVGAIARGRQLVVVGDPKQLPPTNFFAAAGGTANVPVGDDGLPIVEDTESVLEEFMGAGVPVTRLKWHYRSAHESLITFSNVSFYDADLYTFPSVDTGSEAAGLSFEYVEGGVYEGKGLNMAEARRVVDAVVRHAKERPHESLGVGTFNLRQQLAILDELELRRRQDPSLEPFFARGGAEPFFVKNLENIQGDERDVIFLSVTYAKGPDGRLRYNFGPINGENGWRRLNVLTTRARKRMRVFASMRGDEINAAATTSRGALLLRDFLLYAERGRLESVVANAQAGAESPFEAEVAAELTRRGIRVQPQVGVAGYRIDLGVLDDEVAGRFVCGIECDGVAYHSAETARDRDRLRQQVLEARGWTIHRVWSTDWFKDRPGQIARLLDLVERSRREAKERLAAEAEAEARARELAEAERAEAAEREAAEQAARFAQVQAAAAAGYVRPSAPPYRLAEGQGRHAGSDFLATPSGFVVVALVEVVEVESPVHVDDLAGRVAGIWGVARVGSRIAAKVDEAVRLAVRSGRVVQRGDFLWSKGGAAPDAAVPVRSRTGMRVAADRIAPEEIQAAIALVLAAAGGMTRDELFAEVRQVLGVGRTLAPRFDDALSSLVRAGRVGEGSVGYALRR